MSSSYAHRKVAEALVQGNHASGPARRALLSLLSRDDKLLRELVSPFLEGIVANAIEKGLREIPKAHATHRPPVAGSVLDGVIKTLKENFNQSTGPVAMRQAAPPKAPVSAGHAATIRGLANAYAQKRTLG